MKSRLSAERIRLLQSALSKAGVDIKPEIIQQQCDRCSGLDQMILDLSEKGVLNLSLFSSIKMSWRDQENKESKRFYDDEARKKTLEECQQACEKAEIKASPQELAKLYDSYEGIESGILGLEECGALTRDTFQTLISSVQTLTATWLYQREPIREITNDIINKQSLKVAPAILGKYKHPFNPAAYRNSRNGCGFPIAVMQLENQQMLNPFTLDILVKAGDFADSIALALILLVKNNLIKERNFDPIKQRQIIHCLLHNPFKLYEGVSELKNARNIDYVYHIASLPNGLSAGMFALGVEKLFNFDQQNKTTFLATLLPIMKSSPNESLVLATVAIEMYQEKTLNNANIINLDLVKFQKLLNEFADKYRGWLFRSLNWKDEVKQELKTIFLNAMKPQVVKEQKNELYVRHIADRDIQVKPKVALPQVSENKEKVTKLNEFSKNTQEFIDSLKKKINIAEMNLSELEQNEFSDKLRDPISLDIINIPVRLNGNLYDLQTLVDIKPIEGAMRIDPLTGDEFFLRDLQSDREIAREIQDKIAIILKARKDAEKNNISFAEKNENNFPVALKKRYKN